MSETLKNRIIQALVHSLNIKPKDVDDAIAMQKSKGIPLEKALLEKGLIKEEDLMVMLVKELHIPFINLKKYKIDPALKDFVSERLARQYQIVPISRMENTITVALADPLNIFIVDDLSNLTGHDIDVVMSTESDIQRTIESFYGSASGASVKE